MSRIPEAVARVVAYALDGEFHDGEGLFFGASVSGNVVKLTVQDAENDEQETFILTIEAAE